jgi:hypothetical protein
MIRRLRLDLCAQTLHEPGRLGPGGAPPATGKGADPSALGCQFELATADSRPVPEPGGSVDLWLALRHRTPWAGVHILVV